MEKLVADELTIEIAQPVGTLIRLDWLGKSNARQPNAILKPFFSQVKEQAVSSEQEIEMHFERLAHFNSSTITALIQLIQDLRNSNIRLVVVFDGALKWQKLSFDALRIFEKPDGLLTIRSVGES